MQGWQRQPCPKMPLGWETKSNMAYSAPWQIDYEGVQYLDAHIKDHDFNAIAQSNNLDDEPVDELLLTPQINVEGKTGISLQFDYWYYSGWREFPNDHPDSSAEILLSLDGGVNFNPIYTLENTYAEWYTSIISLDEYSYHSDLRIAFRYYDNSEPGNWGMLFVDNVKFLETPDSSLFIEDFDNDILDTWWSDTGDSVDYSLLGEVNVPSTSSSQLTIETIWRMETPYDGGLLEVSIDGGVNWEALSNEYTVVNEGEALMPEINDRPVLNGAYMWTSSNEWVRMSYDLTPYSGLHVLYRFRLITDDAFTDCGWFIRNIWFNGELVDPSTMTPTPHPKDDWMVTVYFPAYHVPHRPHLPARIIEIDPKESVETGLLRLSKYSQYPEMYIIISDTIGPNDYGFGIIEKSSKLKIEGHE